ncbi:CCA tRNA nucleotidyltransferase [Parvibaculum sp.]|uniref:CCA tRNA nucleotidyltransferase n=1 Tax=Parvibaculum sp. TaxID=2024848 RepID=UPI001B0D59D0|nr:CCA tRNA nucleotidyltransferase [Parvibaculum sp.]MBO6633147.1 CCA tRNA nucleotidyltransferase [Parvibaculum sp.]MBO6679617.1 CCA tRNA nucleotidyltransferase [Parvibaculum sp.]MBO6684875.1 CCA tRNA nucleotidyltransferase [Parvibaculum sp.]MBO6905080.1 CCA tRNA nucleotidyltransferase [Parvibaculum sp.]
MSAEKELARAPWLNEADTKAVMDALQAEGGAARFVGGSVRNALMGEPVSDVDIATTATPEKAKALLEAKGVKVVPTGIDHGTITAVTSTRHFEITTLRVDVATDGRRADVAFTDDWVEDAKRRDFTMNALYCDADGTVHDPLGGLDDLKARRVRFIGDPHERIREDYLRILRFFRFHAWYGKGEPDDAGLRACAEEKEGLRQLSGERVRDELFKIASADNAGEAYRQMAAAGILAIVLPEASRLDRFEKYVEIEATQLFAPADPVLRLGAMLDLDAAGVAALAQRLKLSNKDRDRLAAMLTDQTKIVCYLSMREVRRALYLMGLRLFKDRVSLGWADDRRGHNAFQWRAMLAMADSWEKPELPLTGEMIKAAGVPEGPEIGRVRKEVEEWWVDSDFIDDEFSIIERLKAVVQATVY